MPHNPLASAISTSLPAPLTAESVSEQVLTWVHVPPPTTIAHQVAPWDEAAWRAARETIQTHGIGPLLYHCLHATPSWSYLPGELQAWLAQQYEYNDARLRRMIDEMGEALALAHEASIPVVPLKGSALVVHVYDDPALRPMADVDLLVRPTDEPTLASLLSAQGYRLEEETPRHRSFARGKPGPLYLEGEHPDNPRNLELHTEARESFWGIRYDVTAELWEGRPARFGGAPALLSNPVALMQHLLIHASTDIIASKVRLVRLYDVVLLGARLSAAEWGAVVRAAQVRGEERMLYAPLVLVRRYWRWSPPGDVMARLEAGTPRALCAFLEAATLYHLSFCNPMAHTLGERLSWHRPGLEQALAVLRRLVPAPDEVRQFYPHLTAPTALPLAYLTHIWSLGDGLRRRLFHMPRRPWLRRDHGGK